MLFWDFIDRYKGRLPRGKAQVRHKKKLLKEGLIVPQARRLKKEGLSLWMALKDKMNDLNVPDSLGAEIVNGVMFLGKRAYRDAMADPEEVLSDSKVKKMGEFFGNGNLVNFLVPEDYEIQDPGTWLKSATENIVSRKLTASDRKNLIRLASSLPKGSEERRAILAGLKSAYFYHETMPRRGKPTLFKGDLVMFKPYGSPRVRGAIKALYTDRGVDFADIRGDDGKFYEEFDVFGLEKVK